MAKLLRCGAIIPDCGHIVRAESVDEILRLAAEHAKEAHGVKQVDEAMLQQVRAAITDD
jgi:predicted small metal-binding protein